MSSKIALKAIRDLLDKAHQNGADKELQQEALQASFGFLNSSDASAHLFCDAAIRPIVVEALALFSFPPGDTLTWLQAILAKSLSQCYPCAELYHTHAKHELRALHLDVYNYPASNVELFLSKIAMWDRQRVSSALRETISQVRAQECKLSDQKGPGFQDQTLCSLFEVLWNPSMCDDSTFQEDFQAVFIGVQEGGKLLRAPGKVLPAMYSFSFSSNKDLRKWSSRCFTKEKTIVDATTFQAVGKHELVKICRRRMNSELPVDVFWLGLEVTLRFTDPPTVFNELRNNDINLLDFIVSEISSLSKSLQPLLLCLKYLLHGLGTNAWSACPMPSTELGRKIINNPAFLDLMTHPENAKQIVPASNELSDMLSWTLPITISQFGGTKYRVADYILQFLLDGQVQQTFPAVVQKTCKLQALLLIQALLKDTHETADYLQRRGFQFELRSKIDQYASVLRELAFDGSCDDISQKNMRALTRDCILETIKLDCSILWKDYVALSTTDTWTSRTNRYTALDLSTIWALIVQHVNETNMSMIQQIIEIIGKEISLIDTIEIKSSMTAELRSALELYNKTLNTASRLSNSIIRDIGGMWSQAQLLEFLSRPATNEACIASLISPNHETYQEALNLLKEAHQVDGRIEALRESFRVNFASTTQGFIHIVNTWSREGIFKSAVRIIRTGSNILDVLFSAHNGLITTGLLSKYDADLFTKLWKALWRMLETAYRMALVWAEKFAKEELIEFMRDVLECSSLLLGKFRDFERAVTSNPKESRQSQSMTNELDALLLDECLRAVKSLTAWLRLNDEELLQSCVNLICEILQRLAKAQLKVSDDTIHIFNRMIISSKKHKNYVNEAQRTEIYIALSAHTDQVESPTNEPKVSEKTQTSSRTSTPEIISVPDPVIIKKTNVIHPDKTKSTSTALKTVVPLSVRPKPKVMTAQERAEFLKNRAALPAILKKPTAKNVSAGVVRKEESSDSESDSGSEIESLFSTGVLKVEKRKTEKNKASAMAIPLTNFVRDARTERNRVEQNLRARVNPDLTGLHNRLLSWAPLEESEFPPDTGEHEYTKLVNTYQTSDKYRRVVEPLFLMEVWQHIVNDRENLTKKDRFEIVLQSRSAVDNFVDLVATMSMTILRELNISDTDLIILSTINEFTPRVKNTAQSCLAKVQGVVRKKDIAEVSFRTVPNAAMLNTMRPAAQFFAAKLGSLTPIHREYATLQALPYYDLCNEIVLGRPTKGVAAHPQQVQSLMKAYGVNEPQAKAIDAALHNTGFTLVQGPPGTGKTKTILGMVGAFLSSAKVQGTAISIPGQRQAIKKDKPIQSKILLCAPSNAAVDEIVVRLKTGIFNDRGEKYIPKIVRMGMSDAINVNVRDVTLDCLLDDMLNRADDKAKGTTGNDPTIVREKLNAVLKERDSQRALLEKARTEQRNTAAIEAEIKKLNTEKTTLGEQLDDLRDRQSQRARAKDIERKRFQAQILGDADIICATLSGSGHELMASISVNFETVIIDEACQTTELSALIPLKYGCTRCIMVGDPNQLPPTVLSIEAVKYAYNESLFVRMQRNNPNAVKLLAIQYRMHSSISRFPSKRFYDGELHDGPLVDLHTRRAWHNSTLFGTYRFFDVRGQEQQGGSHSVFNPSEAKVALAIVKRLQEDFFDIDFDGRIGIITPYKEQHNHIRRLFQREFGTNIMSSIDFNTIDGFQGQEKDIIIFSCVRANEQRGIGFLSDVRRMNVALTRAKSSIFLIGHAGALRSDKNWRALLEDAEQRQSITRVQGYTFNNKTRIDVVSPVKEIKPTIEPIVEQSIPLPTSNPPIHSNRSLFNEFSKPVHQIPPLIKPMKSIQHQGQPIPIPDVQTQPISTNGNVHKHIKRKQEPSLFIKRKKR